MKLLDSLLDAIVRLEGDALVMHVGEKPYVVTTSAAMHAYRGPLAWGQVELSSRVLSVDAVRSMVAQILPAEQTRVLDDVGAVEHEIAAPPGISDRFTVVAARGGDDLWLELRRQPVPTARPEPIAQAQPALVAGAAGSSSVLSVPEEANALSVGEVPPAEMPAPVQPSEGVAEISELVEAAGEIEERVPVLNEVSQHEPAHVEHVVIPVHGREGQEHVPLESVTPEAFEVVDDVPQEVPSDSEVDALLAATASALLTSGLGAEVETVEEEPQGFPLEPGNLELDEELSAALAELHRSEQSVAEAAEEPVDAVSASDREASEEQAVREPSTAVQEVREEPAAVEPEGVAASGQVTVAHEMPPEAEPQAEPLPAPEAQPAAAAGTPETEVERKERVGEEAAVAGAAPVAAPEAPTAEEPESTPAAEVPPAASPIGRQIEDLTRRGGEETTAVSVVPHATKPVTPDRTVAASIETPTPIPEPRIPVSETLSELQSGLDQNLRDTRHGVIVPLERPAARPEGTADALSATFQSALKTAGVRGASTGYFVAQSKPVIRVNGEIVVLEEQSVLTAADVAGLVAALGPPRQAGGGEPVEWMCDVPDVGRVRCLTFQDHRGPGVIFRMDQAGLPPEVKALSMQPDGLVVIAGQHASGKSTLLDAFVDQINVTRGDHVIAFEPRIAFVHQSRRSFISQRAFGENAAQAAAAVRAALREDPDVIVIEDVRSEPMMAAALEAAESGRLVLVTVTAPSAVSAVEQILESVPAERRGRAARSLAAVLRGVVSQVLVRRARGGRVPAREVLLVTSTVASMIRDGRTHDLSAAFESGRGHGMVSMTDALMSLVREGAVHPAEAWRKAADRTALVARMKQEGIDTAFADRLV